MPEIVRPGEPRERYLRVALEGEPKTGKTRLATSLPWGEYWGEKAFYVPADDWDMDLAMSSVMPENRDRLITLRPSRTIKIIKTKDGPVETVSYDPHKEAFAIASRNWRKEVPEAKTLIWDTMTSTARELLRGYADTGVFVGEKGDKHVTVGEVGSPEFLANPMMGDYSMAQQAAQNLLGFLFRQPLHIIVLFHVGAIETASGQVLNFGPATVGQAAIRPIAGMFDNLLRTDVKPVLVGKPPREETRFILHTQRKGLYLGGIRTGHAKNPIPTIDIPDEKPYEAWETLTRVLKGEK